MSKTSSLLLSLAFLHLASCATAPAFADESFNYMEISEGGLGFHIAPERGTFSVIVEGAFDIVATKMDFCDSSSGFTCFFDNSITFGFPKDHIDANSQWVINDHDFRVADTFSTPKCGDSFIIHSSKDGNMKAAFVFNHGLGLQSMMFVDSIQSSTIEGVSISTPLFRAIYQAHGIGFGGSGGCGVEVGE